MRKRDREYEVSEELRVKEIAELVYRITSLVLPFLVCVSAVLVGRRCACWLLVRLRLELACR